MSYVRFGEDGSDVYVFESTSGLECCGCVITPYAAPVRPVFTDLPTLWAHLEEHRAAGHTVPDWLEEELANDWPLGYWPRP